MVIRPRSDDTLIAHALLVELREWLPYASSPDLLEQEIRALEQDLAGDFSYLHVTINSAARYLWSMKKGTANKRRFEQDGAYRARVESGEVSTE